MQTVERGVLTSSMIRGNQTIAKKRVSQAKLAQVNTNSTQTALEHSFLTTDEAYKLALGFEKVFP
jgi:hypothetical protein